MNKLLCLAFLCLCHAVLQAQDKKFNDTSLLQPIEVNAVRAGDKAPFTKINLTKKDIVKNNLGQDLPFLLQQTPGIVVNSDAGNGVGYTNMRIRGSDASRINVTLNGIPYNDAESQGTFFVDLPDFSSSINSIQIQRGVGTSSNGAGAFGASINLSTNEINKKFYTELNNSIGSFNTVKNTLQFGSGLIGKHFTIDGRLSRISSNGYIDRASSKLQSYYLSTTYATASSSLRLNIFSGKEKTYQSWYGVPESLLRTNRTFNSAGTEKQGAPYDDETDNYLQTHYQFFYNQKINQYWKANVAIFLTRGKGYYEQYKADRKLWSVGLPDYNDGTNTITQTDWVRQLWLDNSFYGTVFSAQYKKSRTEFTVGGGWNTYDGKHFGKIVWAKVQAAVPANFKWYDLSAIKKDFSLYTKLTQELIKNVFVFADVQYRNVNYNIDGFRDNPTLAVRSNYNFVNPKIGVSYNKNGLQLYGSYAMAQKEPNRDDFEAGAAVKPKPEQLHDIEIGIEKKKKQFSIGANLYYMKYKNQLALTGKINDVGAYTRINIPNSFRAGVELQGSYIFNTWINVAANIALSRNRISNFTAYIDDYDNGGQKTNFYKNTAISFSPAVVAGATINIIPLKNGEISFISKYVSRQYLDNTAQKSKSLAPFYVQDVRLSYNLEGKILKATSFIVQLNNVFSKRYAPNGYTFSYISGGNLTAENYYFPMAPFNMMVGVNVKL
jgi:iron complex outermembrane recepter protein